MRVSADEIKGWLMLGAIGGAVLFVWSKGGLAGAAGALLGGAWDGVKSAAGAAADAVADAVILATPEELAAQEAAAAPLWAAFDLGGIDAYAALYGLKAAEIGAPVPVTGSGGAAFGVYRLSARRSN